MAKKNGKPAVKAEVTSSPVVEKKELKLVDRRVSDVIFDTKVNLQTIFSSGKDKYYLKITLGENQDKVFLVTARSDGKGVCVLTDYEEYQYNPKPSIMSKV